MASKAAAPSVLTGATGGEFISVAGLRVDGRRSEEVRRLRARLGALPARGRVAYLEQGNTKVVAVVYGPRELKTHGPRGPPRRATCIRRHGLG
ncbi:hypothetical protein PINS_up016072 [Pythium insidiosum]|nr:hypothetical protein PINS_up016072 [Pythium insidiosum]